jgi:flagellar hook-basal body complex protein FliE
MPSPTSAAQAYASLARLTDPSALGKGAAAGGGGFGALLKDVVGSINEAGRKADAEATAMAAGKTNIVDVVTAVAESEVAIDAVVAVRDKVIQAYEDIMKMPI